MFAMRLLCGLLLLLCLVVWATEARKGGKGRRMLSRERSSTTKRFAVDCKESTVNGEKFFDCQERHLTAVLLGWPEDIHHLLLARNRIQVLRDNTFSHFRNLKSLDLQQNKISRIEEGAFNGLSRLTTLLLQHNRLQVASEGMLIPMPQLKYLRLHDNPWRCDCQLDSLVRFIQVPSHRNIGNYALCVEPREFWGRQLKKLDAELLCSPQQENGSIPASQKMPDATSLCHTYSSPCAPSGLQEQRWERYCSLFWGTFGEKWERNQVGVVKKQTHYPVSENPMIQTMVTITVTVKGIFCLCCVQYQGATKKAWAIFGWLCDLQQWYEKFMFTKPILLAERNFTRYYIQWLAFPLKQIKT